MTSRRSGRRASASAKLFIIPGVVKLQCPEVDFVCRGDGEQLILDLVERLDDPADVPSLTWAKDGRVVNNPNRTVTETDHFKPFQD